MIHGLLSVSKLSNVHRKLSTIRNSVSSVVLTQLTRLLITFSKMEHTISPALFIVDIMPEVDKDTLEFLQSMHKEREAKRLDAEHYRQSYIVPLMVFFSINYAIEILCSFMFPMLINSSITNSADRTRSIFTHIITFFLSLGWVIKAYDHTVEENREIMSKRFGVIVTTTILMVTYSRLSSSHYSVRVNINSVHPSPPSSSQSQNGMDEL